MTAGRSWPNRLRTNGKSANLGEDRRPGGQEGRARPHPLRLGLSGCLADPPAGGPARGLRPMIPGAACPANQSSFNPQHRHRKPQIPAPKWRRTPTPARSKLTDKRGVPRISRVNSLSAEYSLATAPIPSSVEMRSPMMQSGQTMGPSPLIRGGIRTSASATHLEGRAQSGAYHRDIGVIFHPDRRTADCCVPSEFRFVLHVRSAILSALSQCRRQGWRNRPILGCLDASQHRRALRHPEQRTRSKPDPLPSAEIWTTQPRAPHQHKYPSGSPKERQFLPL